MTSILEEGELSLFFFGGEFSHAIRKVPKPGDFRVQEEHGGEITLLNAESRLIDRGRRTLEALPVLPLYARIDLVSGWGELRVMEVELIEPALYFRMDPAAPYRFAECFDRWMSQPQPLS